MYEPAVLVERGSQRETSLTNEPNLAGAPGTTLAHAGCLAAAHSRHGSRWAA